MLKILKDLILFMGVVFSIGGVALEKLPFELGGKKIYLEIADNDETRAKGLMFRQSLAENEGMLFVFENASKRAFWMKNTIIPLAIGFFDDKGVLVERLEMIPPKSLMDSEPPRYESKKSAQAALEMNAKWFDKSKIPMGTRLHLLEKSKSSLVNKVFFTKP